MTGFKPLSSSESATRAFAVGGLSVVFVWLLLLCFPICFSAQTILDDLRNKIAVGSTEEKRNALFEIRVLHSEEAARLAIPALSDPLEMVRATAVSSVVFLPPSQAVKLLTPLLNDPASFVRRETAFALGEVGDRSATAALVQDLQREKEIENRSAAAMALGKVGGAETIEPLLAILTKKPSEPEQFVRATAARSIGEIAQAIRSGRRQTVTPQDFLPEKYKNSLGANISSMEIPQGLRTAIPVLGKVLENSRESSDTRRGAAFALGAIGDSRSAHLLRSHVNGEDPYLGEICKEALLSFSRPN